MKVERRKLTAREWAAVTSSRPVVRRVLEREKPPSRGPMRRSEAREGD